MTLDKQSLELLTEALSVMERGFDDLPQFDSEVDLSTLRDVLMRTAKRMQDNFPYHHPVYAGQMLKPPHPIARLAYMLAMWVNPNNHALDGGRASSFMEKEAVTEIAHMFGWQTHLGHLTSGGTVANLEALWIARCLHPDKKIVASQQAHYTHSRISGVLGISFEAVPVDAKGKMDTQALEAMLKQGDVGTVVATLGTTAVGSIDPLPRILELCKQYSARVHVDSAYGGYFTLASNLGDEARAAYDCISEADSIVVDPHKHGLQPYGCGCVIFKDPSVGQYYKHDSPYTYFTSSELHLGEISLECSRAGASGVALWTTMQLLPLARDGEFAKMLEQCRSAALDLFGHLESDSRFITAFPPELDIVIWAPKGQSVSEISKRARLIFEEAERQHLYLAVTNLPTQFFNLEGIEVDQETITCLRSCLMKPEHQEWMDKLWALLSQAADQVLGKSIEYNDAL